MGGACIFGPQCELGLTCLGSDLENGMQGTCGPLGEAGATCGSSADCMTASNVTLTGTGGGMAEECPLPMSAMGKPQAI